MKPGRLPRDGARLRKPALDYPDAYEEMPWGHHAIKVKTENGLGRSGWLTARFPRAARVPVDVLRMWIDESYPALAPKRLLEQLDQTPARSLRAGPQAGRPGLP